MDIEEHYGQLLDIHSPWQIRLVDLKMQDQRVDIEIVYADDEGPCPVCGAICPKHDDRKRRSWRHLDTMQFATYLHCELPRVRCKEHSAKTVKVPWAEKSSRFTLLFRCFPIRERLATRCIEEARKLLDLYCHQVVVTEAFKVMCGLPRREAVPVPYIVIDEKKFLIGHRYICSLMDLQGVQELDVGKDRTEKACKVLTKQPLNELQRQQVTAVALGMWKAYANAVAEKLLRFDIIHDLFHISQHLKEALNKVHRHEIKQLINQGNRCSLVNKSTWPADEEPVSEAFVGRFSDLDRAGSKVYRAGLSRNYFSTSCRTAMLDGQ